MMRPNVIFRLIVFIVKWLERFVDKEICLINKLVL